MLELTDTDIKLIKESTPILIGKRIKELRLLRNFSQTELAHLVRKDRQYIYKIEKGIVTISISTLFIMCTALKVTISDFFSSIDINYQ